jgi:hypothetical protein
VLLSLFSFGDKRQTELDAIDSLESARAANHRASLKFDSNEFVHAVLILTEVIRYLGSSQDIKSALLRSREHPAKGLYFSSIDLFGRSLRKVWCLDEAEAIFCLGIKTAMHCPGEHLWAQQYFSRWVSIFDRRDMIRATGGNFQLSPAERPPDASTMKLIRNLLEQLDCQHPFEDKLMIELREVAKVGKTMPNLEEMGKEQRSMGTL